MNTKEDDVYNYLHQKTYKQKNGDGQVKITASDMMMDLDSNEQTIYSNLRRLKKREDVCFEIFRVIRFKEGRKIVFNQTYWWCK